MEGALMLATDVQKRAVVEESFSPRPLLRGKEEAKPEKALAQIRRKKDGTIYLRGLPSIPRGLSFRSCPVVVTKNLCLI